MKLSFKQEHVEDFGPRPEFPARIRAESTADLGPGLFNKLPLCLDTLLPSARKGAWDESEAAGL